ncbi:MAG: hypothetical protein SVJ22_10790 [Halobacteriota archaeon]|nr:hypothetical protein [Halobacteriota archaeon]
MMRDRITFLSIVLAILVSVTSVSMCLEESIPVVNVKLDVVKVGDELEIRNVQVNQSYVTPIQQPTEPTVGFPSVETWTILNNQVIGYRGAQEYTGEGTYELTSGFRPEGQPKDGDYVKVTIKVYDKDTKLLAIDKHQFFWKNQSTNQSSIQD